MKVVLRADASVREGAGHVMRCLTLAEELIRRGHDVSLVGAASGIAWLARAITASGVAYVEATRDDLNARRMLDLEPDWVVVDSYRIDAHDISAFAGNVPVLAIVDGESRGIDAPLLLEQNLGSEDADWSGVRGTVLAGAPYSLIRDAILDERRRDPWHITGLPRVTAFMGGTDPTGTIVDVARQLAAVDRALDLTILAPEQYHPAVLSALGARRPAVVLAPTPWLPRFLGASDIIVSAAGTSSWDVCTLGIPAVLVGVIDNQSDSLARVMERGLALGTDLTTGGSIDAVAAGVDSLLGDTDLRRNISRGATALFDGLGKVRVADAIEAPVAARL